MMNVRMTALIPCWNTVVMHDRIASKQGENNNECKECKE